MLKQQQSGVDETDSNGNTERSSYSICTCHTREVDTHKFIYVLLRKIKTEFSDSV